MSKDKDHNQNFEIEYKKLAENDIPDLWDRIEAGLSDRPVTEAATVTTAAVSALKARIIPFKKYAGLAAACLFAAILFPLAANIGKTGNNMAPRTVGVAAADQEQLEAVAADEAMMTEAETAAEPAAEEPAYDRSTSADMTYDASDTAAAETAESEDAGLSAGEITDAARAPETIENTVDHSITNSLERLAEKNPADMTAADIKTILETPVAELHRYFHLTSEDVNLWNWGNTSSPMGGLMFSYSSDHVELTELPEYLHAVLLWYDGSTGKKGKEIPIGYTLDEVLLMPQWGDTKVDEYNYYWSRHSEEMTTLKGLTYHKDGLVFNFHMDDSETYVKEADQDRKIALAFILKE